MYILGISAFYHDSAACLIKDGKVIWAIEEERLSRIKHDNSFPFKSIDFCLKQEGISINNIDYVAYYEKPLLKFERIIQTFVEIYPFALKPFLKAVPEWFDSKIKVEYIIKKKVNFKGKVFFIPHHLSHASAAFLTSPYQTSAILIADGVGEYQTTTLWQAQGSKIKLLKHIDFPDSLGLLYSTFTAFLGFRVNEDEYKVMGLAAYGQPTFLEEIKKVIEIKDDGSFKLNMKYFSYRESFRMWSNEVEKLFGSPRKPNEPVSKKHKDIASSLQKITEEIYFKILYHLYALTKNQNLCLGGGVALNALANGKVYQNTPFKNVWVFGPAGDSGGALGAALYVYHNILHRKLHQPLNKLYLGSEYDDKEIGQTLKQQKVRYYKLSEDQLISKTARLLAQNKVIGWFQDRMEFGPRALGARSILANPKPIWIKDRVNLVKRRELFRPFAGSILQEKVDEYFEVPEKNHHSPFMTLCFQVKKDKREDLAAICHQDNSCRIQTVNQNDGLYYQLIKKFYKTTGIPCVLNTSFNLRGEPIAETPTQAIKDFLKKKMDYLVIGNFLIFKSNYKE